MTIDRWFTVGAMLSDAMVHPTIMVSDMGRARAFYEALLGLQLVREMPPYVFLRAGTSQLALVARANVAPSPTTICAFEVDDLERTVSALRARGVVFEEYDLPTLRTSSGIAEVGPFRAAWLRDPDGNYVGIHDKGR